MLAANWKLSITKSGGKPNSMFSHIVKCYILSGTGLQFEASFTLHTAIAL